MSRLDESIAAWRQQMLSAGLTSPEVLDELEAHLREEIERLIHSGATEQQAFEAAVGRIGPASVLKAEFAKVGRGNNPPRWKFLRIFYFISVALMLLINTWTLLEYEMGPLERFLGIFAVSLVCLYLAGLPYLLKSLPAAAHDRFAKAIKMTGSLVWVWPIYALLEAEHKVHLPIGMVPTTVLWCLYAAVVMTALVYSLNDRGRRRGNPGDSLPPWQPHPEPNPPTRPCPPDLAKSLPAPRPVDPIVQQSVEAASCEASRLGHDFIGTEHLLLGILKLARGSFANVLRKLNVDCDAVRMEIERLVCAAPAQTATATIPFTPRVWKAIRLASREAKALNHGCIGAEHVFLGLLLEGSGLAGQVLKHLGIQVKRTREEIRSESRARRTC